MTRQEEKKQLRQIVRRLEAKLDGGYQRNADNAIVRHLLALPEFQTADHIFCFVSTEREINTRPILEAVLAAGKSLSVPRCIGSGNMELRQITDLSALVPGTMGIWEPTDSAPLTDTDTVDFAIIPCLTCNHAGQRLGRGGGYYDRFLSHYRGGTVMLCRELLIRDEIPVEPHDYPIPWVLTERGLYEDGIPARLG